MPMTELEPIDPETAVQMYLDSREREVSKMTLDSHRSRLQFFTNWCADNDIENLNNLTGRDLHAYRIWRRNDGDLAPASEKTQMATLRVFIRWCESIDGVPLDLHTKVVSPELSAGEGVRDTRLQSESAEKVLARLEKYYYAELGHVIITLLWRTMMRRASVIALDVDDYNADEQYLTVKHRPETGTQLKNGKNGERFVALRDDTCTLLDDWLADRRPDVSDEHGREPLLATKQGRPHPNTISSYAYATTRPCTYGECPHERDVTDCEAAQSRNEAYGCPRVSAHTQFGVEESLTASNTASPRRQSATARTSAPACWTNTTTAEPNRRRWNSAGTTCRVYSTRRNLRPTGLQLLS